jgi:hypothetical protein
VQIPDKVKRDGSGGLNVQQWSSIQLNPCHFDSINSV